MHKPMNTQLADQFKDLKEAGLLKVKYPSGYKKWKAKFDYWFNLTKDLQQTFNIMYGNQGGVNNYRGSLYCNSGFKVPIPQHKKSKAKKHREKLNG